MTSTDRPPASSARLRRLERAIVYVACGVAMATLYGRSAGHGFLWDDWRILQDLEAHGARALVTRPFAFYQPMGWTIPFGALTRLFGTQPAAFTVASLAALWAVAVLSWELVVRVTGRSALGQLPVLYLLLAPSTALVVFWPNCLAYLLAVGFELGVVLLLVRSLARDDDRGWRIPVVLVAGYLLAWLSKSSVLLFPVALVPLWYRASSEVTRRGGRLLLGACAVSLAVYLLALVPAVVFTEDAGWGFYHPSRLRELGALVVGTLPTELDRVLYGFLLARDPPAVLAAALRLVAPLALVWAAFRWRARGDTSSRLCLALCLLAGLDLAITVPAGLDRQLFQAHVSLALAATLLLGLCLRREGVDPGAAVQRSPATLLWTSGLAVGVVLSAGAAADPYDDAKRAHACARAQVATVLASTSGDEPVFLDDGLDGSQPVLAAMIDLDWGSPALARRDLDTCAPARDGAARVQVGAQVHYVTSIAGARASCVASLPPVTCIPDR